MLTSSAAQLSDLRDLIKVHPNLTSCVTVALYDIAPKTLKTLSEAFGRYVMEFPGVGVFDYECLITSKGYGGVCLMGKIPESHDPGVHQLQTKEEGKIEVEMFLWANGNAVTG